MGSSRTSSVLMGSGSVAADGSLSGTVSEHILRHLQKQPDGRLTSLANGGLGQTFAFTATPPAPGESPGKMVSTFSFPSTQAGGASFEIGADYATGSDAAPDLTEAAGSYADAIMTSTMPGKTWP